MQVLGFRKLIGFLFLAITFQNVRSQISDTLYKIIPASQKPANPKKITVEEKRKLIKYAHEYTWPSNKLIAAELKKLAAQLESMAFQSHDQAVKVENYSALGDYYQFFFDRESGKGLWVPYYEMVIKHAKNNPLFEKNVAYAYLGIGIYRVQQSRYEEASQIFNTSLLIFTKLKDTTGISCTHAFCYPLYASIHLFEKAIDEQNQALKFISVAEKKKGLDKFYANENYQDKALIYLSWYEMSGDKRHLDSADQYINRTPLTGNYGKRWKPFHYFLSGYRYFLNKDFKRALTDFDLSLSHDEFYSEINPAKLIYKGVCLLKLGRREAGKKVLLDPSLVTSEHNLKVVAFDALYKDAYASKEFADAIKYLEIANKYKDSMAIMTQRGKILEAAQKYSVIEKEVEIKNLELINGKRQEQRNTIILIFAVIATSLVAIIVVLYNRGRERKYNAMQAEALLDKERRNMEDISRLQERDLQRARKKAIYNFRKKISRDLHDELTSALAGLKYYVNDLRLKEVDASKKSLLGSIELEVESVYVQARSYMHNLNAGIEEVVGNLNPFLQNITRDLSKNKDLEIKLKYDKTEVESKLSTNQQNQLTLMLKEAMSNVLKHSGANKIQIVISFQENRCHFSITDNGKGFGKTILEKGLGMESMELRIKRIKGQTTMHSSSSGTSIEGSFPLQ